MNKCPQCGLIHPPLKSGVKCPMVEHKDSNDEVIDFSKLFKPLKNICIHQIEQKKIKNVDKFFSHIIMEITRFIITYKD